MKTKAKTFFDNSEESSKDFMSEKKFEDSV